MPDLTGQATTLRTADYASTGFISHVERAVVFSRAVNMASIEYPVKAIVFDNPYSGVGAYTDVEVGQTVLVYDGNTSTVKGILRVAAGGASSTTLQVNEFPQGVCDLTNNDRFEVLHEWDIFDVLVSNSESFNKDSRIAYVDQLSDPPPICNSGGDYAGFVDDTTGKLAVTHYGDTSARVDPDSGSLSHSWEFGGDATPTSSTDENPSVSYPAGKRFIKHTVTDSNGASSVQHVFVHAAERTGANAPLSVQMRSISGSVDAGYYRASFALPAGSEAALSTLPDRAYILYWEVENYGGTVASYGANVTGRSHIKFGGYLDRTSIRIDSESDEVTFEAVGVLGILEKTGALPQLLINESSPDRWQEMKSLTLWRALWYLLYWGATAMLRHDFLWPDGTEFAYSRLTIEDTSSILGQLRDLAQSIRVQVTCDWLGRILLIRDPDYLTNAERAARTQTYTLREQDVIEVEWSQEHRPNTKLVIFEGITAAADEDDQEPVFALAPGKAPGAGTAVATMSRQIVADLAEARRAAGDEWARLNGYNYTSSTGELKLVPKGVRVRLPDQYHVFDPMLREMLVFILPADSNTRGISFGAGEYFTAEEITITYDAEQGTKEVELVIDHETHGAAGVRDRRPTTTESGIDPTLPEIDITLPGIEIVTPPVNTGGGLVYGSGRIGFVHADGTISLTADFHTPSSQGGPTYINNAISGVSGTPVAFVEKAGSSPKAGKLVTTTHIFGIADLTSSTPAAVSELAFVAANAGRAIDFDYIHSPGQFGIVVTNYNSGTNGSYYTVTNDGGATWSAEAQITNKYLSTAGGWCLGVAISPHRSGYAYGGAVNVTGAEGNSALDALGYEYNGSAWSLIAGTGLAGAGDDSAAGDIHIPFYDNDSDSLFFHGLREVDTSVIAVGRHLIRVSGGVREVISPVVSGTYYGPDPTRSRWSISTPSGNNRLFLCGTNAARTASGVWVTANSRAATVTWDTIVTPAANNDYKRVAALDPDGAGAILFGTNGKAAYWNGTTLDDRSTPSTSAIIGIFGW